MCSIHKGDYVVATWGLVDEVCKVVTKPTSVGGVLYLNIEMKDGARRKVLAQWWRKADIEEIQVGSKLR